MHLFCGLLGVNFHAFSPAKCIMVCLSLERTVNSGGGGRRVGSDAHTSLPSASCPACCISLSFGVKSVVSPGPPPWPLLCFLASLLLSRSGSFLSYKQAGRQQRRRAGPSRRGADRSDPAGTVLGLVSGGAAGGRWQHRAPGHRDPPV